MKILEQRTWIVITSAVTAGGVTVPPRLSHWHWHSESAGRHRRVSQVGAGPAGTVTSDPDPDTNTVSGPSRRPAAFRAARVAAAQPSDIRAAAASSCPAFVSRNRARDGAAAS
jgi:hypothetical protein